MEMNTLTKISLNFNDIFEMIKNGQIKNGDQILLDHEYMIKYGNTTYEIDSICTGHEKGDLKLKFCDEIIVKVRLSEIIGDSLYISDDGRTVTTLNWSITIL